MTVHNTPHNGDPERGKDDNTAHRHGSSENPSHGDPDEGRQEYTPRDEDIDEPPGAPSAGSREERPTVPPRAPLTDPSVAPLLDPDVDAGRGARQRALRTERLRTLGQMASGVAHDLSQSLALIAGYGELLERELSGSSPDARRLREYAAIMRSAATDGGELARRLLTFSRVQAHGPAVRVEATSLLEDVARLTAPRWRDATRASGYPVALSVRSIGDEEALAILGWSSSLRDALKNLVLNAVDALPSGGDICLGARRDGDMVELIVADTGIGMTAEVRARIFEPFFTTKGARGTGLGLAQVFAIVQHHRGEVEVHSAPGRGTSFILRLPAASPARADQPGAAVTPDAGRTPLRVLAVDDDPAHGRMLAAMLGHDGHQVSVVGSAEAALERMASNEFDVVVSDLLLGGRLDGWHLAERVRQERPGVRVCLVTGWGAEIDPTDAARRGVDAVLAKPYGLGELLAVGGAR